MKQAYTIGDDKQTESDKILDKNIIYIFIHHIMVAQQKKNM